MPSEETEASRLPEPRVAAVSPAFRGRGWIAAIRGALAEHWLFALVFGAGATLRVLVCIAYPYPFVQPDSRRYLNSAILLIADDDRPSGYSLFLRLVPGWRHDWPIPIPQHILGLAIGILLYWLLVRRGVPAWGSALATIPVLLDPFQVVVEHYVLSDIVFGAFLVGALVALSIRRRVTWQLAALGGLLLGGAVVTRAVGEVLVPIAVLALLLGQARWRPAVVFLIATAIPVGGYMVWYHSDHGSYSTGRFPENILYERVVRFADCDELDIPAYQRPLCPDMPKDELNGWFFYGWSRNSPWRQLELPPGVNRWEMLHDFNRAAIRQQPIAYAELIVRDTLRGFRSRYNEYPDGSGVAPHWRFGLEGQYHALEIVPGMPPENGLHIEKPLARALRAYNRFYLPGAVFAAFLLVGLAATVGLGHARRSGMRSTTGLFSLGTLAILLTSSAISIFSWRYQLVQFWLLPPAAAMAIAAFVRREPAPDTLGEWETLRRLAAGLAFWRKDAAGYSKSRDSRATP
jgi:4-amino-4-deoxy-L-arabinose transferase-like glycosyltransferase